MNCRRCRCSFRCRCARDLYHWREQSRSDETAQHNVGSREEWLAARNALLEREKELTRRNDDLARERRELPWGAGGEGVQLRDQGRPEDLGGAVRRALAAARLQLHVRAGLHGRGACRYWTEGRSSRSSSTRAASRPSGSSRPCSPPAASKPRSWRLSRPPVAEPQFFMRVATLYFVTEVRCPGVSPAGIAFKISSPRL
jgi:hypothetical protein